jgi:hypothetical protein
MVIETLIIFLVDRVEHRRRRPLDDLVFQRSNSERALLSARFKPIWDTTTFRTPRGTRRWRTIGSKVSGGISGGSAWLIRP